MYSDDSDSHYNIDSEDDVPDFVDDDSSCIEEVEYDGSSKLAYTLKSVVWFIGDVMINAAIIIVLVIVIRHFIFSPFQVSGPSMCDTLNNFNDTCVHGNGEYIIVNKLLYFDLFGFSLFDYDRGDIIVFTPPEGDQGEYFIKRIIGLPGETVKIDDGYVYIYNDEYPEGFKLDEQYLNESNYGKTTSFVDSLDEFEVPENMYFVMGDNRRASSDSRRCFGMTDCTEELAFLDSDLIEGKGWLVLWPLDRIRFVGGYDYGF
ncbi:MAG: Signal peptidase I [uncultured bacterium]|nr:MAG: Signal peptidase I [uncultured bacterium]